MPALKQNNIILGIGNTLLSDDGVGIKIIRYITKNHPDLDSVHIIDSANINSDLTVTLEKADNLIVIEAARLGHTPGTITSIFGSDLDRFLIRTQRTANETALADIFRIVQLAKRLPANRALIAIEPRKTSWGNRLSAAVNKAIPLAAQQALSIMNQWVDPSTSETPPTAATSQS